MRHNKLNTLSHRQCTKCKEIKELSSEFPLQKGRLLGYGYLCRLCERERSRVKNKKYPRLGRWALLSPHQKILRKKVQKKYARTSKGRSIFFAKSYRQIDLKKGRENDITPDFLLNEIFNKECAYCGDDSRLGCDRLDNSRGHTKDNVVPCCMECNVARSDHFTFEEMKIIGEGIRSVKRLREEELQRSFMESPHKNPIPGNPLLT